MATCDGCDGAGRYTGLLGTSTCDRCGGTGVIPTAADGRPVVNSRGEPPHPPRDWTALVDHVFTPLPRPASGPAGTARYGQCGCGNCVPLDAAGRPTPCADCRPVSPTDLVGRLMYDADGTAVGYVSKVVPPATGPSLIGNVTVELSLDRSRAAALIARLTTPPGVRPDRAFTPHGPGDEVTAEILAAMRKSRELSAEAAARLREMWSRTEAERLVKSPGADAAADPDHAVLITGWGDGK